MKTHIQCGYEDKCKNKDCLKCNRRLKCNLSLTLAEQIAIEDFATCDLKSMMEIHPKELELMQKIMIKVMKKVFKNDTRN